MLLTEATFITDCGVFFGLVTLQVAEARDPLDTGTKVGSGKFLKKKRFGDVRRRKPDFCTTVAIRVSPFVAPCSEGVILIFLLHKSRTGSDFMIGRKGGALFC